jgi:hypothetical protein
MRIAKLRIVGLMEHCYAYVGDGPEFERTFTHTFKSRTFRIRHLKSHDPNTNPSWHHAWTEGDTSFDFGGVFNNDSGRQSAFATFFIDHRFDASGKPDPNGHTRCAAEVRWRVKPPA